ncbi:hypothetical protein [Acinetobacter populi]|nr:hypothetical protein [Acinetobacter populi]
MMHFVINDTQKKTTESAPVKISISRMQKALAAERFRMPEGLSREEKRQHILNAAKGK